MGENWSSRDELINYFMHQYLFLSNLYVHYRPVNFIGFCYFAKIVRSSVENIMQVISELSSTTLRNSLESNTDLFTSPNLLLIEISIGILQVYFFFQNLLSVF